MLELHTPRLVLRPLAPAAAAVLPIDRAAATDLAGAALSPEWPSPTIRGVMSRQAGLTGDDARFGIWLVIDRGASLVVGDAGFHGPPKDGELELGYAIVPSARGQGLASEATAALTGWALALPEIDAIRARCDPTNEPSVAILTRLGFALVGGDEAELHWRLAAEDHEPAGPT